MLVIEQREIGKISSENWDALKAGRILRQRFDRKDSFPLWNFLILNLITFVENFWLDQISA